MAVLGYLVKTLINIKSELTPEISDPVETQKEQLFWLLNKAKDTAFGKYYAFNKILASDNPVAIYQEKVPIVDYHQMHDRWWKQQQQEEDITWVGKPDYFALSSGTTGKKSKRIPVTEDMLKSIRSVGIRQAESLANFDLPSELFEKGVLMLGSSTSLEEKDGHLEGEISGISASNLPSWFDGYYKPGEDIAAIEDWDEKVESIAKRAPEWDIAGLSGIPSWMILMLEKVIEYHQLDTIHDIWPNLTLYTTGGVAFEPYRASLNQLTARPLKIMDTYLASEGFFAYNNHPDIMAMRLAVEHSIFFEFIPFDERGFDETGNLLDKPLALTIGEVEEDQDYALIISTPAGAWRYMIGDTIKFTNLKKLEIVISGRTKYFLNVVGSQLSEEKINTAIQELNDKMSVAIKEYAVAALQDEKGEYYHQWVLGTEDELDTETAAEYLDDLLKEFNKNYRVARGKALKYIKVQTADTQEIYDWIGAKKKKGGQIKVPKVMKSEKMEDLMKSLTK